MHNLIKHLKLHLPMHYGYARNLKISISTQVAHRPDHANCIQTIGQIFSTRSNCLFYAVYITDEYNTEQQKNSAKLRESR